MYSYVGHGHASSVPSAAALRMGGGGTSAAVAKQQAARVKEGGSSRGLGCEHRDRHG